MSSTETLEAAAAETGYTTSAVATAAYTINQALAAAPSFSPGAGTYTASQTVTISTTTPGAKIYYTTNGTAPTPSSVYSGPITCVVLEAIAAETGYTNSTVATAAYTINQSAAAAPSFSPAAGTYTASQTVTISTTTPGAKIYYTTNGTAPTTSSSVYSGPITVSSSETLEAIAAETGYTTSSVATAGYTINQFAAAILARSRYLHGVADGNQHNLGAKIYYTTNGTAPTTPSSVYSGPIRVSSSETLEAIAAVTGYTTSTVATAGYTINQFAAILILAPQPVRIRHRKR